MSTPRVAVLSAVRTPIGRFLGSFATVTAAELGAVAAQAALERAGVSGADIDEVIFGNARQAGGGPNPARQVSIKAGVPETVPAFTVNKACGSGLKSLLLGAQSIQLGEATAVLVGGTENMTRVPYMLDRARLGYRLGHAPLVDGMYQDGFLCPLANQIMGETAETLAGQYGIPREEQDAFALESQRKAGAAWDAGRFADELVPVTVRGGKSDVVIDRDEHPRPDTTPDQLAKLPPVFSKTGTVSAGNSSGITDGAAALVLMALPEAERRGLTPLAVLEASASAGVDPRVMGLGPVPATQKLLAKTGGALDRFDLVELNEAFAAQVLACDRELHIDPARLNVNGGSIALGHPIGATGARIVVTLLHEMRRRGAQRGLATLCISGGLGLAAAFERA